MMKKIFLIIWHEDVGAALRRYIQLNFKQWSSEGLVEIFRVPENISFKDILEIYRAAADFIETKTDFHSLRQSVALMDLPLLDLADLGINLNPLSAGLQKRFPSVTLASLLVLSFPELHWSFFAGGREVSKLAQQARFMTHRLSPEVLRQKLLHEFETISLFDPSGLRNYIRDCIKHSPETAGQQRALPSRSELCAAIDDEGPYAFLHGYLAYKLGYRCDLATTEVMIERILRERNGGAQRSGDARQSVVMTFEDIFLNFPDRASSTHLSRLAEREIYYPVLCDVKNRIFITAGHKNIDWYEQNRAYISALQSDSERKTEVVYKPSGGIYSILEQAHLLDQYWRRRKQEWRDAGPLYHDRGGGHSAPGRLLVIAERLISRADLILRQAETVQDCIHGATLALEAQELLGYRTPTTTLEAIALRHQLEVKAECMFYGVSYSKEIKSRLREIMSEVKTTAQWFHPSLRRASVLNAQMSVVTEVLRIFREAGQFDEEQQCLAELRKLHRQRMIVKRPWLFPIYPILWYVETLVASFPLFIAAIFLWPLLFGLLCWATTATFGSEINTFSDYLTHSFIVFFGIGPLGFPKGFIQVFTAFIMIMGFTHLGIFIAHLYTLLTRR